MGFRLDKHMGHRFGLSRPESRVVYKSAQSQIAVGALFGGKAMQAVFNRFPLQSIGKWGTGDGKVPGVFRGIRAAVYVQDGIPTDRRCVAALYLGI